MTDQSCIVYPDHDGDESCFTYYQCPPYTAQDLIVASYYLSGVRSPDAQSVTGQDILIGLQLLNRLLNFKQVQTDLIPYFVYNTEIFTCTGQENYFIKHCAEIQSVTFNYSSVRFPLRRMTANQYLAGARPNNVTSLPQTYMTNRVNGGMELRLYFKPFGRFQLNIYGKFFLTDVCLDTDLMRTYDGSYVEYLHWALSQYICMQFGIQFSQEKMMMMRERENEMRYQSPPDPSVNKASILQGPGSAGWAFYNFFRGFVP